MSDRREERDGRRLDDRRVEERDERDGVHRSRPLHPMEGDQRWRLRSDNSSADCLAVRTPHAEPAKIGERIEIIRLDPRG